MNTETPKVKPREEMPGIYEYISQIDKNEKVIYLGILVVSLYLFTNGVVDIRAGHLFAVAVTLGIAWYLNDRQLNSDATFNGDLANKLAAIPGVKYFHLDPDMINIFYSISTDLSLLNPKVYLSALKSIDNLLHIRSDFETGALVNQFESFELAEKAGKDALNSCHAFVHSISDNQVLYDKHTAFVQRLQLLIQRNLDFMKAQMDATAATQPIDVNTHFVTDYNGPVSIDKSRGTTLSESLFNFY